MEVGSSTHYFMQLEDQAGFYGGFEFGDLKINWILF